MEAIHVEHKDFMMYWKKGEMLSQGATFSYTDAYRRYIKMFSGDKISFDDSFVVVSPAKEILALVPLYAYQQNGKITYSNGEEHMRAPVFFTPIGGNLFNKLATFVFDHIKECAKKHGVISHKAAMEAVELFEGRSYFNLLMDFGYRPEYGTTNILDLRQTSQQLWANLRKSYQSLINRARKNYQVKIIDGQNFDFQLCEEYRKLHHLAAGRVTRPVESFHVMYDFIKENKGFLVLIFEGDTARGAYYFNFNGRYAVYGSAATDPSLSINSGVGHLGVWEGVLCAQRQGCHYLDLGSLMHQQGMEPSAKEINIDFFKRGFGGTRVTNFRGILEFGG